MLAVPLRTAVKHWGDIITGKGDVFPRLLRKDQISIGTMLPLSEYPIGLCPIPPIIPVQSEGQCWRHELCSRVPYRTIPYAQAIE